MVLISCGPNFAGNLCFAYRQVLKSLMDVNMRVNAVKTVVLCNGSVTNCKPMKVWRHGRLPLVQITTREHAETDQFFRMSMSRTRALGLPAHVKARIVKSLCRVGLYGAEVGGMSEQSIKHLRASARGALGKGVRCGDLQFWS
eukprot:4776157-Amphidinium_carterae.8